MSSPRMTNPSVPESSTLDGGEGGLTSEEARVRLAEYGPNRLVPEERHPSVLVWLLRPFADPMVVLLLVAGATYLLLGDYFDATIILLAVIPITAVTLLLETRAERALTQLKQLTAPTARVLRDGQERAVPAEELVPGDIVFIQEGDIVPADGVLVEGAQVMVDESALTGESHPVVKDGSSALPDRQIFAGTTVLSGRGVTRVAATGGRTRYGQIGALVATISEAPTPLQRLIHRLIRLLAVGAIFLCVGVAGIELAAGRGWSAAIIAGVSLGIAAIPEEFPMVYTLFLALGAWRLARERALVRRLAGVETLGSTTVICSDKTGTLTLGRVEVASLATIDGAIPAGEEPHGSSRRLLEAAVLASEPNPFDPLEQAMLRFAESHGVDVTALHRGQLVQDYPFDPSLKYMSHVWRHNGVFSIAAKGSIEGILDRSRASADVRRWALEANQRLASEGMRILAVAAGMLPRSSGDRSADERHLRFAGLVAFSDPLRPGVPEALRECREAGIRVIMITGDHPVTAHAIAEAIGLPHEGPHPIATGDELDAASDGELAQLVRQVSIFARTRPEQKYRLVRMLRAEGQIVAMTGDGINDAPALREADIGVAMGQRGTEVARAAATMVLLDDNFATIVSAVRQGRRIFDNLRRSFSYLIAFHTPILLAALIVPLLGAPLLLLPVHLVWLELIVHPTASLVFEYDPPPPDLMRRPPRRPGVGLLAGAGSLRATALGVTLFGGVLGLYLGALSQGLAEPEARGLGLATLILGQVFLVLAERSPDRPSWQVPLRGNPALFGVLSLTLVSLLLALVVPSIANAVRLAPLSPSEWALAVSVAAAATLWQEPLKAWRRLSASPRRR